jgi:hypothetical protein
MLNPKRGEMTLDLGGKTYNCKITMDVIMRIESGLGKGILKVAQGLQEADISATEMIAFLTPILRASGKDLKEKDVGEIVWAAGFAEGLKAVAEIIAFVIGGGDDEGNELKAAE